MEQKVVDTIGICVILVLFLHALGTSTITGSQVQDTTSAVQPVSIHLGGLGSNEATLPNPSGIAKITMRTCYNNKKTGQYYRLSIVGYSQAQGEGTAQFTYEIPQAPNWIGGKGKGCQDATIDAPSAAGDIYKIVVTGIPVKGSARFSADFQIFLKQVGNSAVPVQPPPPPLVPPSLQPDAGQVLPTVVPSPQPLPEATQTQPPATPSPAPQEIVPTNIPPQAAPVPPSTQEAQIPTVQPARIGCDYMKDEGNMCIVKETGQDGICRKGLTTNANPLPTIKCVLSSGNLDGCENFGYPCAQRSGSGVCAFANPTAKDYRLRCYLKTCDAPGRIAVDPPSKLMECVKQDQVDYSAILKCSDTDKGNFPNVGGKVTYQYLNVYGKIAGTNPREPLYEKDGCYLDAQGKSPATSSVGKLGTTLIMCKNCYLMEYYCLTDKNEINTKKTSDGGQMVPCKTCMRGQMGDYCV